MGRVDLRKKASEMREWDEEELRMLDRALAKFPQVGGCEWDWDEVGGWVGGWVGGRGVGRGGWM